MTKEEVDAVLTKHKKWRDSDGKRGERVDLRGADIGYSCWPLWCGSLGIRIDRRIAELLYHLLRAAQSVDDDELWQALYTPKRINIVNTFHRVDECDVIVMPEVQQDGN